MNFKQLQSLQVDDQKPESIFPTIMFPHPPFSIKDVEMAYPKPFFELQVITNTNPDIQFVHFKVFKVSFYNTSTATKYILWVNIT